MSTIQELAEKRLRKHLKKPVVIIDRTKGIARTNEFKPFIIEESEPQVKKVAMKHPRNSTALEPSMSKALQPKFIFYTK